MSIGKTGIIPFSSFGSKYKQAGSSALRAEALVSHTTDFEIWENGKKYENLIFQKVYWKEMMLTFKGPKILDLSDPDWIPGHVNIVEIGNLVDVITCSSEKLTGLIKKYFPNKPVVHVPDRLNFKLFPEPRNSHNSVAKKIVWFGYIHNAYETLPSMLPVLLKHNLELRIIADKDYENELYGVEKEYIPYSRETAYQYIKECDIVINPKSERGFFKFKSNNKTIIGWKLGLPVAENPQELERLLSGDQRNKEVEEKKTIIENEYNIEKSIAQYKDLLAEIRNSYNRS